MESSLKKPARAFSSVWKKIGSRSRNGDNFDPLVANNNSLAELEEGFKRLNFADGASSSNPRNEEEGEEGHFDPQKAAADDGSPHALALRQLELNRLQREYKSTMDKLRRANEVDIEGLFQQLDETNEQLTKERESQLDALSDKERICQLEAQVSDLRADLQQSQTQLKQLKKDVGARDVSIEQNQRLLELKDFELTEVKRMLKSRQDIIQKVNFTVTLFQNIVRHQYDEIDQLISTVETKSRTLAQTEDIIQQYINANDQLRDELLHTREAIEEKRELEQELIRLSKNQPQQKLLAKPSPKRKHYTSKNDQIAAVKRVRKESPPTAPLRLKSSRNNNNINFNKQDGHIGQPKEQQD
ncbi:hypothetical protein TRICI_005864 [Trichomonascus ciferrii]|uniref:Uncharacterized protein n=1 Tax=Trichomonascus ciferrii TaxID=44093 RepID=A0A642UNY0_9ASCO|nr:hypothetical protein TRICI_005864 [Trichomonascus ciferrii]